MAFRIGAAKWSPVPVLYPVMRRMELRAGGGVVEGAFTRTDDFHWLLAQTNLNHAPKRSLIQYDFGFSFSYGLLGYGKSVDSRLTNRYVSLLFCVLLRTPLASTSSPSLFHRKQ